MRGTTSDSPTRSARRNAFATIVSWFETLSRTETPERWLMCGLCRASWLTVAMISLIAVGTLVVRPSADGSVASWSTIAISVSTSSG